MQGYLEAAPHLTFFGFLQRVSNGQGKIEREYALGLKRADLYLRWQSPSGEQRVVFELKLLTERDNYPAIRAKALEQTATYADTCNASEAHIIIFDRCNKTDWKERIFTEECEYNGRKIKIWGM